MWLVFVLCIFVAVVRCDDDDVSASLPEPKYPYGFASRCADDFLLKNPSLPSRWIFPNKTFGGRESLLYGEFINHADSSVPDVKMMEGPQGLRDDKAGKNLANRTIWPAAASYGMAWSPELAFYGGKFLGADWKAVNATVAFAPAVNIHRIPTGGRNWEYIPGEDARLGILANPFIHGLQSHGLMATVKSFVLNNQELNKDNMISVVDEMTLYMQYLRPFIHAIRAGAGGLMCSVNEIQFVDENGHWFKGPKSHAHACGSKRLNDILRKNMGFGGAILTAQSAQMTNTTDNITHLAREYVDWELSQGRDIHVPIKTEKDFRRIVKEVLTGMFTSGIITSGLEHCENAKNPTITPPKKHLPDPYVKILNNSDTAGFAAVLITESMVLLKNKPGVLPLPPAVHPGHGPLHPPYIPAHKRILLAGSILLSGGGSGDASEPHERNGNKMFKNLMRSTIHEYTKYAVEWDFEVEDPTQNKYEFIILFGAQFRTEGEDGYYNIDQCNSSKSYSSYGDCDYVTFIKSFDKLRTVNLTKVIAVTTTGGVHYPDYMDLVNGSITMMYPGEHLPLALAWVLKGLVSPGGKLTYTLPTLEHDGHHIQSPIGRFNPGLNTKPPPHHKGHYQNIHAPAHLWDHANNNHSGIVQYSGDGRSYYVEKNLVGYKYYERYGMVPAFPFGFGLSLAKYRVVVDFEHCKSHAYCKIKFKVRKDQHPIFPGIASETLQVYVGFESPWANEFFPIKELREFRKVWSEGDYVIKMREEHFMTSWQVDYQRWRWPCHVWPFYPGWFKVYAGTSSDNILETIDLSC